MEADRRQVKRNQEMLAMGKGEKDRKWSVGLSAGNTPYSSSRSFGGMSRLNSRSLYATPINMGAVSESDEQTAYSQVLLNNRDCSSTTDVKHKMPVTVGLDKVEYYSRMGIGNWNELYNAFFGIAFRFRFIYRRTTEIALYRNSFKSTSLNME